jgi:hypothetical protein
LLNLKRRSSREGREEKKNLLGIGFKVRAIRPSDPPFNVARDLPASHPVQSQVDRLNYRSSQKEGKGPIIQNGRLRGVDEEAVDGSEAVLPFSLLGLSLGNLCLWLVSLETYRTTSSTAEISLDFVSNNWSSIGTNKRQISD